MGRDYCSLKVKMMMQSPDRRTLLVGFRRTCWLSPAFGKEACLHNDESEMKIIKRMLKSRANCWTRRWQGMVKSSRANCWTQS
jgi:hypothetical protein